MGLFLYTLLFPGGDPDKCRAALERKIENPDHNIRPDNCQWHIYPKGPAVQLNDGAVGLDYAGPLSKRVHCPVLLAYIYDDDFWGYELWQGGRELDQFASVHDYFDEGSPPDKPGDADLVARCFGVEPERVRRYLLPWDEEPDGYAYEGDEFTAGDSWQMADFLDALGFDYDRLCPPPPEPEKPSNQSAPTRAAVPEPPFIPAPRPKGRVVEDTPILPSALTDRPYALERAEGLGRTDLLRLLESGKYQDLSAGLAEEIQDAPEEPALYLLRAFCWKGLEHTSSRSRTPDMLRDLTRALELEPDNVMALRGRTSLTTTSRRYPQQIQDLTRLMELDPENRDLHQASRAYFHHWLKDDAAARVDLNEVLERGELWTVDLVYLCRELGLPGF